MTQKDKYDKERSAEGRVGVSSTAYIFPEANDTIHQVKVAVFANRADVACNVAGSEAHEGDGKSGMSKAYNIAGVAASDLKNGALAFQYLSSVEMRYDLLYR